MIHIPRSRVTPFDFGGLGIADFGPGADASASVAHISVPPGAKHPEARSRKSDKYYYCIRGPISFTVDGKSLKLDDADLLVIKAGEWFSYANAGKTEGTLLLIHVPPFDMAAEEIREPA
jgi:mannose-6-phosphate isomerase-like protein (cupin superfamily)